MRSDLVLRHSDVKAAAQALVKLLRIHLIQPRLFLLVLSTVAIGLFFRFYHLEQKYYWFDEAFTSLRISGFTELELVKTVAQPQLISVAALLNTYQYPNLDRTTLDTIKSLAIEEPQHPPLYFILARFWMQSFGNSIAAIRSLSALFSLCLLPCIYWLCLELFQSVWVGWIAIGLTAISPFQVLYAQEAREYSLWIVLITLSSALLLRSLRTQTRAGWWLYAVSLSLGLYTFPANLTVAIAHGIYVVAIEKLRWSKPVKAYLLAAVAAILTFVPWLIVICIHFAQVNKTLVKAEPISALSLIARWAVNLDRLFIDLSDYEREISYFGFNHSSFYWVQIILAVLVVGLVAYSFYFLYDKTAQKVWLFILVLVGTAFPIMVINLLFGGKQSIVLRYFMPACLGVELAMAFLFASQLARSLQRWQQHFWQGAFAVLMVGGILSCAMSSQVHFWWTKSHSDMNYQIAPVINQSDRSLLISDAPMGRILAFSHLLNGSVQLQLSPSCFSCPVGSEAIDSIKDLTQIPSGFSAVFLYNPSVKLLNDLKSKPFKLIPVYVDPVHPEQQILRLESLAKSTDFAGS